MQRLQSYVAKYGPEFGPKYYHIMQSRSARVGVSARLRRKIAEIQAREAANAAPAMRRDDSMPLFPEEGGAEAGRVESGVCPIAESPAVG